MEIALLWIEPSKTHPQIPILDVAQDRSPMTTPLDSWLTLTTMRAVMIPPPIPARSGSWIRNLPELRGGQHPAGHTHRLQQSGHIYLLLLWSQQVEFVHESVPEYDLQFFQLSDEWNGCDSATTGPSVTVSTFPSLVPVSDAPSYVETTISSQYATSSMISMEQFQGLPEYGDCFTVDRTFQDTSANPYTGCRTGQVTYDYSIGLMVDIDYYAGCDDPTANTCTVQVHGYGTCPELRGGQHPAGHTHRLQQSGHIYLLLLWSTASGVCA
eukprot:Sro34_g021980.2  (269) ;mRNA; r:74268-75074